MSDEPGDAAPNPADVVAGGVCVVFAFGSG